MSMGISGRFTPTCWESLMGSLALSSPFATPSTLLLHQSQHSAVSSRITSAPLPPFSTLHSPTLPYPSPSMHFSSSSSSPLSPDSSSLSQNPSSLSYYSSASVTIPAVPLQTATHQSTPAV